MYHIFLAIMSNVNMQEDTTNDLVGVVLSSEDETGSKIIKANVPKLMIADMNEPTIVERKINYSAFMNADDMKGEGEEKVQECNFIEVMPLTTMQSTGAGSDTFKASEGNYVIIKKLNFNEYYYFPFSALRYGQGQSVIGNVGGSSITKPVAAFIKNHKETDKMLNVANIGQVAMVVGSNKSGSKQNNFLSLDTPPVSMVVGNIEESKVGGFVVNGYNLNFILNPTIGHYFFNYANFYSWSMFVPNPMAGSVSAPTGSKKMTIMEKTKVKVEREFTLPVKENYKTSLKQEIGECEIKVTKTYKVNVGNGTEFVDKKDINITAKGKLTAKASEVNVNGDSKVTNAVGGCSFELSSSGIKLNSPGSVQIQCGSTVQIM